MTQDLVPLSTSTLQKAEVGQLPTRFLKDYDDSQISLDDDLSLTLLSGLRSHLATYNHLLEEVKVTETSTDLVKADDLRDENTRFLLSSITIFANSRDADEQKAHQTLNSIFKNYKTITSLGYENESAQINHLLEQVKDKAVAPYVKLLGIERFITRLEASQEAFEAVYHSYAKNKVGGKANQIKEARKQLLLFYQDLADHIAISARHSKNTTYSNVLAILNRSRKSFAESLAIRKGISKKKAENQ